MKIFVRAWSNEKRRLVYREITGAVSVIFCEDPEKVEGLEIREEEGALRISAREGVLSIEPGASTMIKVRERKP